MGSLASASAPSRLADRFADRFAVVVVDWSTGELLGRGLSAPAGQTLPPALTVVVDNGGPPASWRSVPGDLSRVEVVGLEVDRFTPDRLPETDR